ncbi:hypothetical protein DX888_22020 [Vibrio alginolyticus]|nr:hypothetical protein [Vibrio alginolyticus]
MAQITPIKLCEFKRLVEHGNQLSIVAQKQASDGFSGGARFSEKLTFVVFFQNRQTCVLLTRGKIFNNQQQDKLYSNMVRRVYTLRLMHDPQLEPSYQLRKPQ